MSEPNAASEAQEAAEQNTQINLNDIESVDPDQLTDTDLARIRKSLKDLRSEAKSLRERAKASESKAAQFDELEAAKKTELERITEERERLMFELETAQQQLVRERVARRYNLPDSLADRIQGKDESEMDADAKSLANLLTPTIQRVADPALGHDAPMALNGDPLEQSLRNALGI